MSGVLKWMINRRRRLIGTVLGLGAKAQIVVRVRVPTRTFALMILNDQSRVRDFPI